MLRDGEIRPVGGRGALTKSGSVSFFQVRLRPTFTSKNSGVSVNDSDMSGKKSCRVAERRKVPVGDIVHASVHDMHDTVRGDTMGTGMSLSRLCHKSRLLSGPHSPKMARWIKINSRTAFSSTAAAVHERRPNLDKRFCVKKRTEHVGRSHRRLLLHRPSCLSRRMHGHLRRLCLHPCVSALRVLTSLRNASHVML